MPPARITVNLGPLTAAERTRVATALADAARRHRLIPAVSGALYDLAAQAAQTAAEPRSDHPEGNTHQ